MEGVIYYNIGKKCLVRLAVSISTLVRYYRGDVTILADEDGYSECEKIAISFGVNIKKTSFNGVSEKNNALLNKCRMHLMTPYDNTIFIDSDTIILQDFSECFQLIREHDFIVSQFSTWPSMKYRGRIKRWWPFIDKEYWRHSFDEPKAVNIGFYGWSKEANIFDDWYWFALKNADSFIPDEISCQILLPHYKHLVIGKEYNTSCKHDTEKAIAEAKIIHFHGRKHCRLDNFCNYIYHSNLWYEEYDKISNYDIVKNNVQYDAQLRKNLYLHDVKRQKAA